MKIEIINILENEFKKLSNIKNKNKGTVYNFIKKYNCNFDIILDIAISVINDYNENNKEGIKLLALSKQIGEEIQKFYQLPINNTAGVHLGIFILNSLCLSKFIMVKLIANFSKYATFYNVYIIKKLPKSKYLFKFDKDLNSFKYLKTVTRRLRVKNVLITDNFYNTSNQEIILNFKVIVNDTRPAFVYKWVHKVLGYFYYGRHTGTKDDGYVGSGILFNKLYKHDKDNWERKIISEGTATESWLKERELVNLETLHNKNCLNISLGGYGYKYTLQWHYEVKLKQNYNPLDFYPIWYK